jgi:hypothetical protein
MPTCPDCQRETKTEQGLRRHRAAKHPPERQGDVWQAAKTAIAGADHLTELDQAAVEVLLKLAGIIDGLEERDPEAPMDNVTIPTFLKYAESLGLTPLARVRLNLKPKDGPGKLGELRAIRGGRAR